MYPIVSKACSFNASVLLGWTVMFCKMSITSIHCFCGISAQAIAAIHYNKIVLLTKCRVKLPWWLRCASEWVQHPGGGKGSISICGLHRYLPWESVLFFEVLSPLKGIPFAPFGIVILVWSLDGVLAKLIAQKCRAKQKRYGLLKLNFPLNTPCYRKEKKNLFTKEYQLFDFLSFNRIRV